jgi:signal peptidase II
MKILSRSVLLCLLLAATAGCDRVTKHLAMTSLAGMPEQSFLADTIRLEYHENSGGFLSAGATWRPEIRAIVFQVFNAFFLTATGFLAMRYQWSRWAKAGLVMFLAGGFSNLVDRIAMGRVIDFLNVGIGPFRTGIFNVADVAIVAGIGVLLVEHWRRPRATV